MKTKLIVGLGNPGKQYEKTRHNIGFMVVDELLKKLNLKLDSNKFEAEYVQFNYKDEKVIIAKPLTYMNLSSNAVIKIANFYKIDVDDILVVHDDLDLPLATVRIRKTGSSGGQNGMKSILQAFSTKDIKRIKVGISNDKSKDTKDYVLSNFSKEEYKLINESIEKVCQAILYYLDLNSFDNVMNKFN